PAQRAQAEAVLLLAGTGLQIEVRRGFADGQCGHSPSQGNWDFSIRRVCRGDFPAAENEATMSLHLTHRSRAATGAQSCLDYRLTTMSASLATFWPIMLTRRSSPPSTHNPGSTLPISSCGLSQATSSG